MEEFSEEVLSKARLVLRHGLVTPDEEYAGIWWVESLRDSSVRYRVQTDAEPSVPRVSWVTCTCAHGLNKGGDARCYHVAAALMMIFEEELEVTFE